MNHVQKYLVNDIKRNQGFDKFFCVVNEFHKLFLQRFAKSGKDKIAIWQKGDWKMFHLPTLSFHIVLLFELKDIEIL